MTIMKTRARKAFKDYNQSSEADQDEFTVTGDDAKDALDIYDKDQAELKDLRPEATEPEVSGPAKKKEEEKSSGWGKKVAAAIAGTIGAVAGANLQHKQNERKRKIYEAKRKTGNYL